MGDLADVRDGHGPSVVAADHRQAGGAAIHFVDLEDVWEMPTGPRRGPYGAGLELLGLRRFTLELRGHRLGRRCLGRKDLREVERNAGEPAVVVLEALLVHPRAELGMLIEQPRIQLFGEAEEP